MIIDHFYERKCSIKNEFIQYGGHGGQQYLLFTLKKKVIPLLILTVFNFYIFVTRNRQQIVCIIILYYTINH